MWTIVIDDDLGSLKSLDEAIKQTDSNALVQSFTSWLDFFHWLQKIEKKDPSVSIPQMKLRAVFLCVDRLKDKEIVLLPKLKSLLKQLGLIDEVELLSLVLIGFDKPGLEMHKFMSAAYVNFLFKPFDKLLLRQSVDIALNEKGPIKNYFVNNFKASVPIEMLKEIRLAEVTEIGFHTISDQKVESGRLAKYYADFLTTNMHRSSLARAYASRLLSGREFEIDMGFYALDQAQSLNLQKMIQSQKKTRPLPDFPGHRDNYTFVFLRSALGALCQQLVASIERFYEHPIFEVETLVELQEVLKQIHPQSQVLLIIDATPWRGNEEGELRTVKEVLVNLKVSYFLLSAVIYKEEQEKSLSFECEDIYYSPFNRSYVIKTLKKRYPALRAKEEIFEAYGNISCLIHVSNPVQLVQVSEAGLVMEYYRALNVGEFREFMFWLPKEVDIPIILGQCVHVEFNREKKVHHCHFVFYGVRDIHLKHIRLWVLNNYIESKQA